MSGSSTRQELDINFEHETELLDITHPEYNKDTVSLTDTDFSETNEPYYVVESPLLGLPAEEYPSYWSRIKSWASKQLSAKAKDIAMQYGEYAMPLIVADPAMRKLLNEIFVQVRSQGLTIDQKLASVVESIPEESLGKIVELLATETSAYVYGEATKLAISSVPVVGGALGAVYNASGMTKLIRDVVMPECIIAQRSLQAIQKSQAKQSAFKKELSNYIKTNIKPVLTSTLKYAMRTMAALTEPVSITEVSVLDTEETFHFGENSVSLKTKEAIIAEYHRSVATKEFATVMAQNAQEMIGFLKGINLLKYSPDALGAGLASDIGLAIIPRLVADGIAQNIMSNNYKAVSANVKIANAKALAKKMGFELPEPSVEQLKAGIDAVSKEQDHDLLKLYRLRNEAIKCATDTVVKKATEVISSGMKKTKEIVHQFKARLKANAGDKSFGIPEVPQTFLQRRIKDNDYEKLAKIRNMYIRRMEALEAFRLTLVGEKEKILKQTGDKRKESLENLSILKKQYFDKVDKTRKLVGYVNVENTARKAGFLSTCEAPLRTLSSSIENLYEELFRLSNTGPTRDFLLNKPKTINHIVS